LPGDHSSAFRLEAKPRVRTFFGRDREAAVGFSVVGRIVVGVDGSEESREALRWALEEAGLRSWSVRAVRAWSDPYLVLPGFAQPEDFQPEALRDRARAELASTVADVVGAERAVEIEEKIVEGPPARVLIDAAEDADLLVVGSRGLGGFTGLLLGSVSQHCVAHAPCPVLVVRATQTA
jgi:nucleotide-binding universal stress UspA family protein